MTFYGLTFVFMTQPQFASLLKHSGLPCSQHTFLLSSKHFFRMLLPKTPVRHLSWRSQSICDCLVEMYLNYSKPIFNLLIGHWCKKKNQTSSILCVVRALGMKAAVKPHSSFPKWFSLPGVDSDFLTCDSIKFQNKVERKEMHIY